MNLLLIRPFIKVLFGRFPAMPQAMTGKTWLSKRTPHIWVWATLHNSEKNNKGQTLWRKQFFKQLVMDQKFKITT